MRFVPVLLTLAFVNSARADDASLQNLVFGHVLATEPGYACFTRAYDKAHLASHPKQNVTSIMLMLKGKVEGQAQYIAGVDFRFRKSGKHFQAYGDCPSVSTMDASAGPNALHCGIDCDGGTINVNLKDADTILVKLPDGISVSGNGSTDEPSGDRFGSDDKIFKLTRTTIATCVPLATEDEDRAAMKKAK